MEPKDCRYASLSDGSKLVWGQMATWLACRERNPILDCAIILLTETIEFLTGWIGFSHTLETWIEWCKNYR